MSRWTFAALLAGALAWPAAAHAGHRHHTSRHHARHHARHHPQHDAAPAADATGAEATTPDGDARQAAGDAAAPAGDAAAPGGDAPTPTLDAPAMPAGDADVAPRDQPASPDGDGAAADADTAPAARARARARADAPEVRRFYVRAGVAEVAPLSQSRELELADVDGPASLAVHDGPIAGSGSTISSATIPAIIIGVRLPVLHGRLSLETVLGLPFTAKFRATGTLANQSLAPTALGIPTGVQPLGPEIGEAKAAPPVITAVYSLRDHGALRPYAGAGVGVLIAYDAKVTNPMITAVSQPQLDIAPAPGLVLQGGLDARIWHRIYARLDVKFIAFMLARAEVHDIRMSAPDLPLFGSVEVGTAKLSMWVNPLIVQAGIGTDF